MDVQQLLNSTKSKKAAQITREEPSHRSTNPAPQGKEQTLYFVACWCQLAIEKNSRILLLPLNKF